MFAYTAKYSNTISSVKLHITDFLDFSNVSFGVNASIGRLCEDLNNIVGYGVWYDTFEVQNTEWLWLVNNIVTALNNDKVLCGCFGL